VLQLVIDIAENSHLWITGAVLSIASEGDVLISTISSNITISNKGWLNVTSIITFIGQSISIHDTSKLSAYTLLDGNNSSSYSTIEAFDEAQLQIDSLLVQSHSVILHNSASITEFVYVSDSEWHFTNLVVLDSASLVVTDYRILVDGSVFYNSTVIPYWPSFVAAGSLEFWNGFTGNDVTLFYNASVSVYGIFVVSCGIYVSPDSKSPVTLSSSISQIAYAPLTCQHALSGIDFRFENSIVMIGNLSDTQAAPNVDSVYLQNSTLIANAALSNVYVDGDSVLVVNNIVFQSAGNVNSRGLLVLQDDTTLTVNASAVQFESCVWGHGRVNIVNGGITCENFTRTPDSLHNSIVALTITNGTFSTWNTVPVVVHTLSIASHSTISVASSENFTITTSLVFAPSSHLLINGNVLISNSSLVLPSLVGSSSELLLVNGTLFLSEGISLAVFYNSADLPQGASKHVIVHATKGIVGKFSSLTAIGDASRITVEYSEYEIALAFSGESSPDNSLQWWVYLLIGIGGVLLLAGIGFFGYKYNARRKYQVVG